MATRRAMQTSVSSDPRALHVMCTRPAVVAATQPLSPCLPLWQMELINKVAELTADDDSIVGEPQMETLT